MEVRPIRLKALAERLLTAVFCLEVGKGEHWDLGIRFGIKLDNEVQILCYFLCPLLKAKVNLASCSTLLV